MLFPVGNKGPETQLPSFLHVALERAGPGGRRGLLRREVGQRLPWGEEFCCGRLRCGPRASGGSIHLCRDGRGRGPSSRPRLFVEEGALDAWSSLVSSIPHCPLQLREEQCPAEAPVYPAPLPSGGQNRETSSTPKSLESGSKRMFG